MNCKELYDYLNKQYAKIYKDLETRDGADETTGFKGYLVEIDRLTDSLAAEIDEHTSDWSGPEWEAFFNCHVEYGDPDISLYIIKKITENCGDGFFARVISENTETIRNDVYASPADKEALRSSDALLTATDALNHIKTGGADEAVIGAFEACATANDHILCPLAVYIARECEDKIVDYLENDACEPHKLTELVSEYTISGRKNMRVYDAIKKRFKSMPDESDTKLHFALMLGDYGEPNAILILRKYAKKLIEKYNENRDRELFSNIMMISSAVESLGGSTEDLFE